MSAETEMAWADAATFLDAAERKCGLRELEDPSFPDRLQRFVDLLNDRSYSSNAQRRIIDQGSDNLVARLRIAEARLRDPGVEVERIEGPLVVTGLPRSGTTLLHSLLAEDPASRGPRLGEILDPSLPWDLSSADPARLRELDALNERFLEAVPRMIQAHPYLDMGALSLMECESWLALDFRNTYPNFFHQAQMSLEVLSENSRENYSFHRAFLQHRQRAAPSRRWVLKGTEHHYNLEVLRAVYPDAHVVWIHRDPLKVVPSLLELLAMMRESLVGEVDRPALATEILPKTAERIEALRSTPLVEADFVCHVHYLDFMENPARAVREIYERFEIPYTQDYARRLGSWALENPVARHGRWAYALDDFQLTVGDVDEHFSNYRERFAIPQEDA